MKKKKKINITTLTKKKNFLFDQLKKLYQKMDNAYSDLAQKIGLSCEGCENNCCVSYFQHHTHIEWAYLFKGFNKLPKQKKEEVLIRAREYVKQTRQAISLGVPPKIMCPLNEEGKCILYDHRLMICRLHGVPNIIKMPNGAVHRFPGCFRAVELTKELPIDLFVMDRTPFYIELAMLEKKYKKLLKKTLPKVDHTLAEMLILGEPR